MKRGTSNHPKVYELAEALKVKRPAALGYLQLLWDFAAEYAPEGDIGRYSDARIEAALDWGGARSKLVAALVHSRWVDLDPTRRLVIHDWLDHAEKSVHRKLQRAAERNLRVPQKVTPILSVSDADLETPVRVGDPPAFAFNHSQSQSQDRASPNPLRFDELATRLYDRHPRKRKRVLFEQALSQALAAAPDPVALAVQIEAAHTAWLPEFSREEGKYAPNLDNWINERGYLDAAPAAAASDTPEYTSVEEFRKAEGLA